MAAAATVAQVKHHPLQWNIGRVQRYVSSERSCLHHHGESLQIGPPVVVHHALRLSSCPAGVVDGEQAALVGDGRPHGRPGRDQAFVGVCRAASLYKSRPPDLRSQGASGLGVLRVEEKDGGLAVLQDMDQIGRGEPLFRATKGEPDQGTA